MDGRNKEADLIKNDETILILRLKAEVLEEQRDEELRFLFKRFIIGWISVDFTNDLQGHNVEDLEQILISIEYPFNTIEDLTFIFSISLDVIN